MIACVCVCGGGDDDDDRHMLEVAPLFWSETGLRCSLG